MKLCLKVRKSDDQSLSRYEDYEIFRCATTYAKHRDRPIITQKTDRRGLDCEPSEGLDWNWEDYD